MNTKCLICQKDFNCSHSFANHLRFIHKTTVRLYFDQYLKTVENSICKTCGKITQWNRHIGRYKLHCSRTCGIIDPISKQKVINNSLQKYGTISPNSAQEKIDKTKQVCLQKYGHVSSVHNKDVHKKAENTWFKKYGTTTPWKDGIIGKKIIATCLDRYGVKSSWSVPEFWKKRNNTMLERYGVLHSMQNSNSYEKNIRSCYKRKAYRLPSGTIIYKQGYEPQFLDYIFTNKLFEESDINYQPSGILYINNKGTKSYYYPDFFIPKLNLIIEIKSTYTMKLDKNIENKKLACINKGLKYLRIIDNNFTELQEQLKP